ncbi:hypothetical protein RHMOL_Rhmol01G0161500 [Rhododendron molle]|uniref:Uncharacterized protein n=1 Tax=Rhododendron molle TaxID=49168 RepID=A0ACC0Q2A7_RHOML|nr:hypothetical protein RHMOL_Rhmol01G0161500 [Rhododendron molle]
MAVVDRWWSILVMVRWVWLPWLGCSGRFVGQSSVGGHSEFSSWRGASSLPFLGYAVAGCHRRQGWSDVFGGGWFHLCLVCFDFHCRRPVTATGLYIWEWPAWLNGDVSFLVVCAAVEIEVDRVWVLVWVGRSLVGSDLGVW